jgi:lipoate-protein ligase A
LVVLPAMSGIRLYNMGKQPWQLTQLIYHALARLGREAVVLVSPRTHYASIGFHQDMIQELDLEYCRDHGIPIFRREVGGGAVYLDGGQVFWQLILHEDNPHVSLNRLKFYGKFLAPVVRAYQAVGMDARFEPVNDIICGEKKISGTGAGEIGDCVVFVGNMIRSFDCHRMTWALKMPNERFRQRVLESMQRNMSSLEEELGKEAANAISDERLCQELAKGFAGVLGELVPSSPDAELEAEIQRLSDKMLSHEWTRFRRKPRPVRSVKLRAGVFEHTGQVVLVDQPVRVTYRTEGDVLVDILFEHEAACPFQDALARLAQVLEGTPKERAGQAIKDWLFRHDPTQAEAAWQMWRRVFGLRD